MKTKLYPIKFFHLILFLFAFGYAYVSFCSSCPMITDGGHKSIIPEGNRGPLPFWINRRLLFKLSYGRAPRGLVCLPVNIQASGMWRGNKGIKRP